jgi:hypothetical protein
MYMEAFLPWYYYFYLAHVVCFVYSLHAGDDRIAFSVHTAHIIQTNKLLLSLLIF